MEVSVVDFLVVPCHRIDLESVDSVVEYICFGMHICFFYTFSADTEFGDLIC